VRLAVTKAFKLEVYYNNIIMKTWLSVHKANLADLSRLCNTNNFWVTSVQLNLLEILHACNKYFAKVKYSEPEFKWLSPIKFLVCNRWGDKQKEYTKRETS